MTFQEKLEKFKEITDEEEKIIELVKNNIQITAKTKILDIGSNKGKISRTLQKNSRHVTLVDVEEFESTSRSIKGRWEEIELNEKFDLIIASHVWGHFTYTGTDKQAFEKAINHLNEHGKIVLCYNTNKGFMKQLIGEARNWFNDFQYDLFDDKLIKKLEIKEKIFSVQLKEDSFDKLAELIQVLIIVDNKDFDSKKREITNFLKKNLSKPEFEIKQKLMVLGEVK